MDRETREAIEAIGERNDEEAREMLDALETLAALTSGRFLN